MKKILGLLTVLMLLFSSAVFAAEKHICTNKSTGGDLVLIVTVSVVTDASGDTTETALGNETPGDVTTVSAIMARIINGGYALTRIVTNGANTATEMADDSTLYVYDDHGINLLGTNGTGAIDSTTGPQNTSYNDIYPLHLTTPEYRLITGILTYDTAINDVADATYTLEFTFIKLIWPVR